MHLKCSNCACKSVDDNLYHGGVFPEHFNSKRVEKPCYWNICTPTQLKFPIDHLSQFKISILFISFAIASIDCLITIGLNWIRFTRSSFIVHTINYSPWTKSYQLQSFFLFVLFIHLHMYNIYTYIYTVFLLYSQFKCIVCTSFLSPGIESPHK